MIEIQVNNLVKSFEVGKNVLDGLTFQVDQGERVGLLGRNGAGKTTLFKILTGELDYDEGTVVVGQGRRVGLISQIPVYPAGYTVEDVLRSAFARLQSLAEEMRALEARMAAGESDPAILKRYGTLSERFEAFGGYDTDVAVNKIANGLSIPDAQRQQLFDSLSGGEKTRVNLGRLILEDTDILLLDEPTNHLDLHATEWLEEYIRGFHGTVVTISHDRYFLDRTVTRVIEIQDGRAEFYSGNYSFYAVEKERRYQERMKQYEKEQAKIQQLEKAAEQLRVWAFMGMDKTYRRAISMERRIERMRTTSKPTKARKMDARFSSAEFHGDEVLGIRNVSKSYGDKHLFEGISLKVEGGERIALIGDNGTGKSTLIKMIVGELYPDDGRIKTGPQVKEAYLPQIVRFDHPDWNLVENMMAAKRGLSAQSARNRLAAYDFRGEDVFKPVSVLSGGEQSRLRLCMLMDDEINFLILDEPTNHLDIDSREWIEEAVEAYDGTLLFVSHDRYFINRFATRIWELADGTITDYPCGFAQYRQMKAQEEAEKAAAPKPEKEREKPAAERPQRGNKAQQAARRQLTICERDIARAEEHIAALEADMEAAACDYEKLNELVQQKAAAQAELDALYERWEQLSEEAEG
nr:ABC-F family ATP-binding cassette domain-containing protein [uncultured Oscillibacter sp.]